MSGPVSSDASLAEAVRKAAEAAKRHRPPTLTTAESWRLGADMLDVLAWQGLADISSGGRVTLTAADEDERTFAIGYLEAEGFTELALGDVLIYRLRNGLTVQIKEDVGE